MNLTFGGKDKKKLKLCSLPFKCIYQMVNILSNEVNHRLHRVVVGLEIEI